MPSSNGGGDPNGQPQTQAKPPPPPPQQQQFQWVAHQPQWVGGMQYPPAAMAMMMQQQQQFMMYPQHHYVAYHHYQQYPHHQQSYQQQPPHSHRSPQQNGSGGGSGDAKTIWVGDLHHWMDETYLHTCFSQTGEVLNVKVIRNKQTGLSEGYGFVEFYSHTTAEKVLQNYSTAIMPNTDQPFRLNWAAFSSGNRQSENGSDLSIFVGDLDADVTDSLLQETFAGRYPSVKGAKVVIDSNTGRSKGYGFVRFGDESERSKAMSEMNGAYCSSRPMRIAVATPKKASGRHNQQHYSQAMMLAGGHGYQSNGTGTHDDNQSYSNSSNTTIFVGGLHSDVADEDLRQPFSQFGEVVSVKIPVGKGCGFVQFANRKSAEDAIQELNGAVIGKQPVRLSWGRNPANKQWVNDNNYHHQWNGSYNGGGQGCNGYGNGDTAALPEQHDTAVPNGAS
ncbi:hypothetical protein SAY87_019817 [Trapa incisa]|uniref:RRM domain-containing protein n=1 Tax=Trapa incisa TaxID=236973 RepID=A0AAN7K2H0_9MYRT|nr:hypothetical protein SAY87_019817 [Trapa incisa]